jgi:hypothetical protein
VLIVEVVQISVSDRICDAARNITDLNMYTYFVIVTNFITQIVVINCISYLCKLFPSRKVFFLLVVLCAFIPSTLATLQVAIDAPEEVNICESNTYTVQIGAEETPVSDIIVTVTMPEGFSYDEGSASITFPGGSSTQEPNVNGGRLVWDMTDLFSSGDHVVINEFEQNPPGSDTGYEWVELYNPTSNDVDIGGWELVNGDMQNNYTIPLGTIILSKDFWVYTFTSQWLDNSDEDITLYDSSYEVDKTPKRADSEDDDRSSARFPNGYDTDSDSDWDFRTSTMGASNGDRHLWSAQRTEPKCRRRLRRGCLFRCFFLSHNCQPGLPGDLQISIDDCGRPRRPGGVAGHREEHWHRPRLQRGSQ